MLRFQNRLMDANRDLMRRNQEIQSFYHTLSHELKTPLTAAREFIAILLDGLAGPLAAKQRDYLGIAHSSCEQMRLCLDDLLDATRLETGKMTLEFKATSIAALAREAVRTTELRARAKGIALELEMQPDLPAIEVDEHRITQVISNLLNNAVKYTPAGGRICVQVSEAALVEKTCASARTRNGVLCWPVLSVAGTLPALDP